MTKNSEYPTSPKTSSKQKRPSKSKKKPPVMFIGKKIAIKKLGLTTDYLPKSILEVTKKLSQAGFDAYIVGGGVRDALMGMTPKDFDAVTNATPNQIKEVFGKRCRIIGRRFQLAHVYSGSEMIEVATFRAPPKQTQNSKISAIHENGMVTRDNVWGTIDQDFVRRDFRINALYLEPHKGYVIDFCDAIQDIQKKQLRFLGDTQTRIDEDPVRMLRAIRFAAKLGLHIDPEIIASFTKANWLHLQQVSPHRLYDESLKIFGGGYVSKALPLLYEHGALPFLFAHNIHTVSTLVQKVADNTDARIAINKSINPAFFYAALLWPAYRDLVKKLSERFPLVEAMQKASIKVIAEQRKITAMPRFAENFIRETWSLQPRLIRPKTKQVGNIVELPRFRAAYDFLLMREQAGDTDTSGMGAWWQAYQDANSEQRKSSIHKLQRKQHHEKSVPMALEVTPIASNNRANIQLPKERKALPERRRRVRDTQSKRVEQKQPARHMLADTIRGEKPATHD